MFESATRLGQSGTHQVQCDIQRDGIDQREISCLEVFDKTPNRDKSDKPTTIPKAYNAIIRSFRAASSLSHGLLVFGSTSIISEAIFGASKASDYDRRRAC